MSLAYSDTTNKDGIIQKLEQTLFGDNGDARISGNSTLLAMFTGDVNLALDKAFQIIFKADGYWQFDDSNHTDYPIITTDIVLGQRDYPFTSDSNSNLILEVQKVLVADADGKFYELDAVDQQSDTNMSSFWDGDNTTGKPNRYDKTANAIFLDPIPDYNEANGLKLFISREGSYFSTSDTTKKPGIAGLFHEYLVVNPAYKYAYRNNMANAVALRDEMLRLEDEMSKFYSKRSQDTRDVMWGEPITYL